MSATSFAFGHIPDSLDIRDYILSIPETNDLPFRVDLRPKLQPIKNQGKLGACTAFATTAMVEFVRNKQELLKWDAAPLFTYYATRKIENTVNIDSGASVRDALKSTVKDGVVRETTWPYIIENFTVNPPTSAWEEGLQHQALTYYSVPQTKEAVLYCLAEGYPFTFGAKLYESFTKTQCGFMVNNIVPMPDVNAEKLLGGHCMLAVGYLSASEASIQIMVRNSWGTYVGLDGYHNFPLDYLLDPKLSLDFWTIRLEERALDDPAPTPTVTPTTSLILPSLTPTTTSSVCVSPTPSLTPSSTPTVVPVPPFSPRESIWKQPSTYILIGFVILALLFAIL